MIRNITAAHVALFLACIGVILLCVLFYQNQIELRELSSLVNRNTDDVVVETPDIPVEKKPANPHQDHIEKQAKIAGIPLHRLANIIIPEEGVRPFPYVDTENIVTIAIGRSLQTNGITSIELHAIVPNPNYRVILENTTIRAGRIYINDIDVAKQIFTKPLTRHDMELLLSDDLKASVLDARKVFGIGWDKIDVVRKEAIVDLMYNLGLPHFKTFKDFIESVNKQDWKKAATDLLMSEAARENIKRYHRIASVIETGDPKYFELK